MSIRANRKTEERLLRQDRAVARETLKLMITRRSTSRFNCSLAVRDVYEIAKPASFGYSPITSAHDALNGYVPKECHSDRSIAAKSTIHRNSMRGSPCRGHARVAKGRVTFDYGNNIRSGKKAGIENAFEIPASLRNIFVRFLRGAAVPRVFERGQTSRAHGSFARVVFRKIRPSRWMKLAKERVNFKGCPRASATR
jgi:hypothetical protein